MSNNADALMMSELGGCTEHWTMPKHLVDTALTHLTHCVPHKGVHHFAVTGEGCTLHVSQGGLACLRTLALFRSIPAPDEPAPEPEESDGPRMFINRHGSDID